jgi:MFS family permease
VQYILGGRFVLGFGVAISTTAAPAYVVEMSPPQWRGRLTGLCAFSMLKPLYVLMQFFQIQV